MRVGWTALALADVEAIVESHRDFGVAVVRKLVEPILESTARLQVLPHLGVESRDLAPPGRYRHLVVGRYRVIYRVDEGRELVLVLRVWDTRQDPHRLDPGE